MSKDRTIKPAAQDSIKDVMNKISNAGDASAFDSNLAGVSTLSDIPPAPIGNTSVDATEHTTDPFSPDVVHIPRPGAPIRPANKIDLASLDETTIMDMPYIKAKAFDIAALLDVKLKDPAYRPRWVNFKNLDGGNYAMFKSIGFVNCVMDDIDQKKTPIGEHITQADGSLKYYDVILMKCNTLRLMQAYKANVQKSLDAVGRWETRAIQEARKTLRNEVSADILDAMNQAGYKIDFYVPSQQEIDKDNGTRV